MNSIPIRQSVHAALCAGDSRNVHIQSLCSDILTAPEWRDHGAALLSDIPVADPGEAATAIRTVSAALGVLLPQDGAGQTLREVRYRGVSIGEGATGRYSDSRQGRQWHTDGPHRPGRPPEIFALLCVRKAPVGGALVLIDGDQIASALDRETIEVLARPFLFDQRQPGTSPVPRPVLCRANGQWRFAYLRHYIELGHQHRGVPGLSAGQWSALDRLDAVLDRMADAEDGHQQVTLRPGELIIVDNRRVLHGRTEFADGHPDHGRLMLRTWIRSWGFRSRPSTAAG